MAARTGGRLSDRQIRNTHDLSDIAAMVAEVPETAAEWPDLADGERASFAAEWSNYMGGVAQLIGDYYEGDLTPDQKGDLFALLRRLQEVGPLLDRIGVRRPDLLGMDLLLDPPSAARRGDAPRPDAEPR